MSNSSNPLGERVRLDRTNSAYHDIYHLARLFLKGDYQSTTHGDMKGFSLLFAMNDLFELFIGKSLMRVSASESNYQVLLQDKRKFALLDDKFNLKPDVVIKLDKKRPIVLDTKWKHLDPAKDNFDVKQS